MNFDKITELICFNIHRNSESVNIGKFEKNVGRVYRTIDSRILVNSECNGCPKVV